MIYDFALAKKQKKEAILDDALHHQELLLFLSADKFLKWWRSHPFKNLSGLQFSAMR